MLTVTYVRDLAALEKCDIIHDQTKPISCRYRLCLMLELLMLMHHHALLILLLTLVVA